MNEQERIKKVKKGQKRYTQIHRYIKENSQEILEHIETLKDAEE